MIRFRLPIAGIYESIVRPVSIGVINDIKNLLYINDDVRSKLSNQIESYITNEQSNATDLEQTSPRLEEIKFSVEEEVVEDTLITTSLNYKDYNPIVYDKDIDLTITPIYVDTVLNLNIRYRSRSKSNVNGMINMLRLRLAENETTTLHHLTYMFYVKPELMELLLDVYLLKSKVLDLGSYEDYLISVTDGRLTIVGALNNSMNNIEFAAKETQREVVGYFTSDVIGVKGEYGEDTGMWEATLTYKIRYNKPVALSVNYNPLVYNQLLPKKYVKMVSTTKDAIKLDSHRSGVGEDEKMFNNGNNLRRMLRADTDRETFINIPTFDNYIAKKPNPYTTRIFSVLVFITPTDKRSLFNLGDLPEFEIDSTILNYIKNSENEHINNIYHSPYHIELIEGENAVPGVGLKIGPDLEVSARVDLDLTKTYRVIFSLVTDLSVLSKDAKKRLANNEVAFHKTMNILNTVVRIPTTVKVNGEDTVIYKTYTKEVVDNTYRRDYEDVVDTIIIDGIESNVLRKIVTMHLADGTIVRFEEIIKVTIVNGRRVEELIRVPVPTGFQTNALGSSNRVNGMKPVTITEILIINGEVVEVSRVIYIATDALNLPQREAMVEAFSGNNIYTVMSARVIALKKG